MKPTFVITQGRSGGTAISDALAHACCAPYLLEPLNPRLPAIVKEQPQGTAEKMRHRTLRKLPWVDFAHYEFDELLARHATHHDPIDKIFSYLEWLVRYAPGGAPVIKLARGWRLFEVLKERIPEACFIHVWRLFEAQQASRDRVGFAPDYFGDHAAWGLPATENRAAWLLCKEEGFAVADVSLQYEQLCFPQQSKIQIASQLHRALVAMDAMNGANPVSACLAAAERLYPSGV